MVKKENLKKGAIGGVIVEPVILKKMEEKEHEEFIKRMKKHKRFFGGLKDIKEP